MTVINSSPKLKVLIPFLVSLLFILHACSVNSVESDTILRDVSGTLKWGGSPAIDGTGILFETPEATYGAEGTRTVYSDYFPENENQVQIRADFILTGETAVRGWGTEFPEIEFLRISRTGASE